MAPEVSDIFARMETSKKQYIKTKTSEKETEEMGPHVVRLPTGVLPEYVKLTKYQEFSWRTVGRLVQLRSKANPKLELSLLQAHMRMRPEEFVAYVWMTAILVAVIAAAIAITLGGLFVAVLGIDAAFVLIFSVMIVIIPPVLTYVVLMSTPSSKAKTRKRDIDKRIGAAMSFISAMASADVNVDVIFKELSRQAIYGEIKNEAEWITRDTELLGIDILSAISKASQRTPSSKFQEFLQGVVTTSTSGGQLKPYFLQKAEQFEKESKLDMRSQLETLGLMAETFVTVVVAFPLFLVVIMAIMAIVPGGGGSATTTVMLLWLVVVLMIPISQFGFIFFIWNSTKESSI
ncbi:MAG TPA: type II secretion system F family protein [Methanomassiliicoccales archaeon]|nr:type II secretion system F family protein [Methanomassiliicoccales archaeon]